MRTHTSRLLVVGMLLLIGGTQVFGAVAYVVPANTNGNQAYGLGLGMDFDVSWPILIRQIGAFDSGSNGIDASSTLTTNIWNRAGTPAVVAGSEMTFSNADPGALNGGSRFKTLATPILATSGQYSVVSYGYDANNQNGNAGFTPLGLTTYGGGAMSFVGTSRFGLTAGTYPTNIDLSIANRYAAGSFEYATLQNATATYSQGGWDVSGTVDASPTTGWAVASGANGSPQTAAWETVADAGFAGGTELTVVLDQKYTGGLHNLGRFRLSVTTDDRSTFADGLGNGGDVTANWTVLGPTSMVATSGSTMTRLADGTIVVTSAVNPANDNYTIKALTNLTNITGLRLETFYDASDPNTPGPGRAVNRNFVLTDIQLGGVAFTGPPTWVADADGNVSNPANWAGGMPGTVDSTAHFKAAITAPRTITVDVPASIGTVVFDNPNAYTLAGTNPVTMDVTTGSASITVLSGSHTAAVPLILADNTDVNVAAGAGLAISGVVSGTGKLSKLGPGTLTLSGANSYIGGTAIQAGTLQANSNAALGAPANVLAFTGTGTLKAAAAITGYRGVDIATGAAGTIDTNGFDSQVGAITGGGDLVKAGAGVLTLAGPASYAGATTISGGTLRLTPGIEAASHNAYKMDSDKLDANQWHSGSLGYDFTVNDGKTITIQQLGFYDSRIDSLSQPQPGLAEAHDIRISNTSGTTLYAWSVVPAGEGGTLSNGYRFYTLPTPLVLGPGTYRLWGDKYNVDGDYNGGASVAAGPTDGGSAGQITFLNNGYWNGTADVFPTNGDGGAAHRYGAVSFVFASPDATLPATSSVAIASGAALDLNGVNQSLVAISGAGGSSLLLGKGTLTLTGNGPSSLAGTVSGLGGLVKQGAGTLGLTGSNTYFGGTTLQAGTVEANANAALGDVTGPIRFTGSSTLRATGAITGGRNAIISGGAAGTVDTNGFDSQLGGISGGGDLVKAGAGVLTLARPASYGGTTTIAGGTLRLTPASQALPYQAYQIDADKTVGNQSYGGSLGYDFTVNAGKTITVQQLGFYDSNLDGLAGSHNVYVSNSAGTLVYGSAAVPAGTAATLASGYRFAALGTPLVLGSGDYRIWGDNYGADLDYNNVPNPAGPTDGGLAGQITFKLGGYFGGNNTFPTTGDGGAFVHRYGAVSFVFASPDATLPATTAVTIASGATLDLSGVNQSLRSVADGGAGGASILLGGAALTLTGAGAASFTGTISGPGNILKTGTGTQALNGPIGSSGSLVNVSSSAGLLQGNATISGNLTLTGGTVSAGNSTTGLIEVGGNYSQSGATLLAELGGYTPGAAVNGYDQIRVGGTADLAGQIDVNLVNGFVPVEGSFFDILVAAGGINNSDLSALSFDFNGAPIGNDGWVASIIPLGNGAEALRIESVPEPATLALLGLAVSGLGGYLRRRK